jgi:hypothetical protein
LAVSHEENYKLQVGMGPRVRQEINTFINWALWVDTPARLWSNIHAPRCVNTKYQVASFLSWRLDKPLKPHRKDAGEISPHPWTLSVIKHPQ